MSSPATVAELFRDAMAGLCSGVAVLTTRRADASPCGLVATSVSAFSATPPSRCALDVLLPFEPLGKLVLSRGHRPSS